MGQTREERNRKAMERYWEARKDPEKVQRMRDSANRYHHKNRDRLLVRQGLYREANKLSIYLAKKKCYERNREAYNEARNLWRRAHPEWHRQYGKRVYRESAEVRQKRLAYTRAWCKRNPDKTAARGAAYSATKKMAKPKWGNPTAIRAFYTAARRRTLETGIPHDVDHIVPIVSKVVCGLHWEGNLQVISSLENRREKNKLLEGA